MFSVVKRPEMYELMKCLDKRLNRIEFCIRINFILNSKLTNMPSCLRILELQPDDRE